MKDHTEDIIALVNMYYEKIGGQNLIQKIWYDESSGEIMFLAPDNAYDDGLYYLDRSHMPYKAVAFVPIEKPKLYMRVVKDDNMIFNISDSDFGEEENVEENQNEV